MKKLNLKMEDVLKKLEKNEISSEEAKKELRMLRLIFTENTGEEYLRLFSVKVRK